MGVDEVGVGSWAGPAIACAVIVPTVWAMKGVNDSKVLSPVMRKVLHRRLTVGDEAVMHAVARLDPEEIDGAGIAAGLRRAHEAAITGALMLFVQAGHEKPPLVIVDGVRSVLGSVALPKADRLVKAVSAASIIAKVTHDRILVELDKAYPGYGLAQHMGYGTDQHRQALDRLGVSRCHRVSYSPMRQMVARDGTVAELLGEEA